MSWLEQHAPRATRARFAAAPDVVGDAEATLDRSWPWLPVIRRLGYPAALVAQDGLERLRVPWRSFDVLFVGGTTDWKLGVHAAELVGAARRQGLRTHLGRVNSRGRLRLAFRLDVNSVDGTCLTYAPDRNLGSLLGWLADTHREPA